MRPILRGELRLLAGLGVLVAAGNGRAAAQPVPTTTGRPIARAEAVAAALGGTARLAVARSDSAAALAGLLGALALPNPSLSASYSRATPRYHLIADLPLENPGLRRARVGAARAGRAAAGFRLALERAAVVLDVDTAYTRALAARERLQLSRRGAADGASLRAIAAARRDAGEASDLDVQLAMVFAGQQMNIAASDSLTYLSAVLDLQAAMGLEAEGIAVVPGDSLTMPPDSGTTDEPLEATARMAADGGANAIAPRTMLSVAAAQASLESARLAALAERRGRWSFPTLSAGIETGDPGGNETGILPTVGIAVPLPLLERNRGGIALAEAARDRASAELALARQTSRIETERARRMLGIAMERVRRDQALVALADTVAAKALTAYGEGALPLPSVLEARRSAREVVAQYIDDMAEAWVATALLRALTSSMTTAVP